MKRKRGSRRTTGAFVSFRPLVRILPFPLRIVFVCCRIARFSVVHRSLRDCSRLHVGYYRKGGIIARPNGAPGYAVLSRLVLAIRRSLRIVSHLRVAYTRTPFVLSRSVLVFPSSARETTPSLGFLGPGQVSNDAPSTCVGSGLTLRK